MSDAGRMLDRSGLATDARLAGIEESSCQFKNGGS
jgi:hypothetical protein